MPQGDFHLGGQAVMEGVMMRSPNFYAVAVRRLSGEIQVFDGPVQPLTKRKKWLAIPLLRGVAALIEMLSLGLKATRLSADVYIQDASGGRRRLTKRDFAVQLVISFAIVIGLIVVLPHVMTDSARLGGASSPVSGRMPDLRLLGFDPTTSMGRVVANLWEGLLRVFVFVIFIAALGLLPDVKRLFAYHGAEHKVVHAFEHGSPLTVAGVLPFPTAHPRCGTAFVFVVLVFSILAFALLPWGHWGVRIGGRILLLPLVAGLSYELIRFAALSRKGAFLKPLILPGLWLQRLTTREPTPDQLEVAIAAMQRVLECENGTTNAHK